MLVFYVLVVLCLCTDVFYSVLIVQLSADYAPFLTYMPPTWKVMIGVDQIWMIIEFTLRLKLSIEV